MAVYIYCYLVTKVRPYYFGGPGRGHCSTPARAGTDCGDHGHGTAVVLFAAVPPLGWGGRKARIVGWVLDGLD